jgi:NAD(P)-dependent dehydrogenase (short-subunit alcohol dehydrogenase family)
MGPYCATKHAVNGLTKSAAIDYAASGIRINAIAPGAIRTPMLHTIMNENPGQEQAAVAAIPMQRMGRPEEVANAILWLCSDEAAYITGQVLGVDGGLAATG